MEGPADAEAISVRGARQVGKTYLALEWGKANFEHVVTINLEREPDLIEVFRTPDPRAIVEQLSLIKNARFVPGKTLFVIDEIQASTAEISALRYFYEELAELHVLATGSEGSRR